MKKSFFVAGCMLMLLTIGTTSSLKGLIPPSEKVTKFDCKDIRGNVVAFGSTCEPGNGTCKNNPCPWDKIQ